jgi:CRISPR-associated protein Cas1
MPTACIVQPGAYIRLVGERLQVTTPDDEHGPGSRRDIPLRDLDRLICSEQAQLTNQAMAAVLTAGIPVSLLADNGEFLGSFLPPLNSHAEARLEQYRRTLDPQFSRAIAASLVVAKLYNQRRVLQRLGASRRSDAAGGEEVLIDAEHRSESTEASLPGDPQEKTSSEIPDLRATLGWLEASFIPIRNSQSIDEIRGYEGATTARYFSAWARFLPEAFPFERRSTRPPKNAVNSCISFGATLIYNEMVACLHTQGLDPSLGCLHTPENGRWSLALDLIEPFRPVLVEALALDLFSHKILGAEHFEARDGGVYLNLAGRRKFFLQYERRMERQFMSEAVGHRTSLRQQLEQQGKTYKAALRKPDGFEPFLMN